MKKHLKILAAAMVVLFSASVASAQIFPSRDRDDRYEDRRYENDRYGNNYGNGWVNIARTRASRNGNYERININRRYSDIRQLLFTADGPVNIYRVTVRYNNGRTQELNVRNNRRDNRRWNNNRNNDLLVNIPNSRFNDVRQVTFWYDTDAYARYRPTINVMGR